MLPWTACLSIRLRVRILKKVTEASVEFSTMHFSANVPQEAADYFQRSAAENCTRTFPTGSVPKFLRRHFDWPTGRIDTVRIAANPLNPFRDIALRQYRTVLRQAFRDGIGILPNPIGPLP